MRAFFVFYFKKYDKYWYYSRFPKRLSKYTHYGFEHLLCNFLLFSYEILFSIKGRQVLLPEWTVFHLVGGVSRHRYLYWFFLRI
jgi:hypothetical protein